MLLLPPWLPIGLWRQVPQEGAGPTGSQRSSQITGLFFFFLNLKKPSFFKVA